MTAFLSLLNSRMASCDLYVTGQRDAEWSSAVSVPQAECACPSKSDCWGLKIRNEVLNKWPLQFLLCSLPRAGSRPVDLAKEAETEHCLMLVK